MKTINDLAKDAYAINLNKGYYINEVNIPEKLCLIHSEVSEALEADRKSRFCVLNEYQKRKLKGWIRDGDYNDAYKSMVKGTFEEEMADIIIRTISLCEHLGIDIDYHVQAKIRYNKNGSVKKY
ncbi:hypothetical protein ACR79B_11105 [Sphingobacterium spiritivorum]|uniref:hypothetical protein n=1 Tax=Sphingobacterium spiritivorum TaxID=258 RepID=UPI003DA6A347